MKNLLIFLITFLGAIQPVNGDEVTREGVALIVRFEGFRATPYEDEAGNCTVAYGHLVRLGPCRATDRPVTRSQGRALLRRDVRAIGDHVRDMVHVEITPHQFDALVSLAFNIGTGALRESKTITELNGGDYVAAADAFLGWKRAGGRVNDGLLQRRIAERKHFLN